MEAIVRKLKSVVSGNYPNYISVKFGKEANRYFQVIFSSPTTLNGYNSNNELVFTAHTIMPSITADKNVVTIEIENKNNIVAIEGSYGGVYPNIDQLFGCAAIKTLKGGKYSTGDLYNLRFCSELETFYFDTFTQSYDDVDLYGDISVFANMPNIKTIFFAGNDKIVGNISALNSCTNLEDLTFQGSSSIRGGLIGSINNLSALTKLKTLYISNNVHIEGSLTTLAESQKAARSQSTLVVSGNGTVMVDASTVAAYGTSYTISFDGNGGYTIS